MGTIPSHLCRIDFETFSNLCDEKQAKEKNTKLVERELLCMGSVDTSYLRNWEWFLTKYEQVMVHTLVNLMLSSIFSLELTLSLPDRICGKRDVCSSSGLCEKDGN